MQKVFKIFLKKIVNSILNDLYGYLYLKNKNLLKRPGILLSNAARLLQHSRGKNCCWSLLQNYQCNRFASSSISCRECIAEAKKTRVFEKNRYYKKKSLSTLTASFEKNSYSKTSLFDIHFNSKLNSK